MIGWCSWPHTRQLHVSDFFPVLRRGFMLKVGNPVTRCVTPLTVQRRNLGTVGFWGSDLIPEEPLLKWFSVCIAVQEKALQLERNVSPLISRVSKESEKQNLSCRTKFQCSVLLRQGLLYLRLTLNSLDNQRKPVISATIHFDNIIFGFGFACMCICVPRMYSALGDQKKVLSLMEQQL